MGSLLSAEAALCSDHSMADRRCSEGYWYLNALSLHVYSRVWLPVPRDIWFTIPNYAYSHCRYTQRLRMSQSVRHKDSLINYSCPRGPVWDIRLVFCVRGYTNGKNLISITFTFNRRLVSSCPSWHVASSRSIYYRDDDIFWKLIYWRRWQKK